MVLALIWIYVSTLNITSRGFSTVNFMKLQIVA